MSTSQPVFICASSYTLWSLSLPLPVSFPLPIPVSLPLSISLSLYLSLSLIISLSLPLSLPLPVSISPSPSPSRLASVEKFSKFSRLLEANINTLHAACQGLSLSQREMMGNINLLAKDFKCFATGVESTRVGG